MSLPSAPDAVATTIDRPALIWTTSRPASSHLRRAGFRVFEFKDVRRKHIEPARSVDLRRSDLRLPAEAWFSQLDGERLVAVLGVPVGTVGDLRDLYGYVVEPAYRRDLGLLIHADRDLNDLRPQDFVYPDMGYAWTLERPRFLAERWLVMPSPVRRVRG